jgi:hypothetical protein
MSPEQGTCTRSTSNVTVTAQFWTLILLSATDGTCRMVSLNHAVMYSTDSSPVEVHNLAYMIPPLVYPEVRVCPILWFVFSSELVRLMSICHFMYCTDNYCQKSHTGKLHCLLTSFTALSLCIPWRLSEYFRDCCWQ